jgi:hypothetical protein
MAGLITLKETENVLTGEISVVTNRIKVPTLGMLDELSVHPPNDAIDDGFGEK